MFKRAKQAIKRNERTILYTGLYITTMSFVFYKTAYNVKSTNLAQTWNAIETLGLTDKVVEQVVADVLETIK